MTDHFVRWAAGRLQSPQSTSHTPCSLSAEHTAQKLIDHRVDALIIDRLDKTGFEGAVCGHLQRNRSDRMVQEMAREVALKRLAMLARSMKQEFIVLKGTALANTYYEHPHHRPSADIDLFLPRISFEDATRSLLTLDYEVGPNQLSTLMSHRLQLYPKYGGPRLDLHRRISVRPEVSLALGFQKLDERSYPMRGLEGLRVPDAVDQLCHAALYALSHHAEQGYVLIHAWDTKLLLENLGTYPRTLIRRRVGESLGRAIAGYCHWVTERFEIDVKVPETLRPVPGAMRTELALYTWVDRVRLARQLVAPSPAYMRSTGRGATPKDYAARLLVGLATMRDR